MAPFSYSERDKRDEVLGDYLTLAREALTDPALESVMPKLSARLTHILDTMTYIAAVRGGIATTPKQFANDHSVPVIGLHEGQHVDISTPQMLTMHEQQAAQLHLFTQKYPLTKDPEESFRHIDDTTRHDGRIVTVELPTIALGMTMKPHLPFTWRNEETDETKGIRIYTRPLMAFPLDSAPSVLRATTGIHELVHVAQALDEVATFVDPIEETLQMQKKELQAYHIETAAIYSLYKNSQNPIFRYNSALRHPLAFDINTIRQRINKDKADQFEPSEELHDAVLDQTGFDLAEFNA